MPDQPLAHIHHLFPSPLIPGRLIRRYKRFLADVELEDGQKVTVHCPNSGSMLSCNEPGAPVYLSPAANPNRRTAFTWEMIYVNNGWVGVNTGIPNILAAQAARARALPIFHDAIEVEREKTINAHTRLDLLVQRPDGPLYVEVKNVSLMMDGQALFPDAVTTRGAKHLDELIKIAANGGAAAMLYVVQRQDSGVFGPARQIAPKEADP